MLELKGITKAYRTKSGSVNALNGVSLVLPQTGLVFITGKSGCGKTTLLNVIGGLDGADSGEISLLGKSFSSFTPADYDDYRNTFIGFVFQEYNLLNEFSVQKNVELAMELQGGETDKETLDSLMREMEIDGLKSRKPSELSGGQRQRVAIARALVKNPRIIMADEPTGALDEGTGIQVLDLLKKLSKDKLVIVVSHDREFAEKYADRIIRLVDGQIVEDVSYTEIEAKGNLTEDEGSVFVSEGADLSESEKNVLAAAIKSRKKIEVIQKLTVRELKNTDESKIERSNESSPELKSSRMKLKSAVSMGVKSLWVKPLRLAFTILLSALAFAVFGLFDTLASFTTESVMANMMRSGGSSVSLYGEYVVDEEAGDKYDVKISDKMLKDFAEESNCSVKGVYSLSDNVDGGASKTDTLIKSIINGETAVELSASDVNVGKLYFTKSLSGYVEFGDKEIASNTLKPFGYKIIAGSYPVITAADTQIAISSYAATSILHYLNEEQRTALGVESLELLVGKSITVDGRPCVITGIIDCGEIPEKYDTLKLQTYAVKSLAMLIEDFNSFISSSAHKCIFVPEGFLSAHKSLNENATVYYGGSAKWSVKLASVPARSATAYAFSNKGYGLHKHLLFSNDYGTKTSLQLADDEVLVNPSNLEALYAPEISLLTNEEQLTLKELIAKMDSDDRDESNGALISFLKLIKVNADQATRTVSITKTSNTTGSSIAKDVKVVGVYVGINKTRKIPEGYYCFMMNDTLMDELQIFNQQGDYNRFLIRTRDSVSGSKKLVSHMLDDSGFTLVWYGNSALKTIRYNEDLIKDTADLFLIAALVLALFSVFMLFNYVATSIANKRQSIGVLRGLGSRGKDILITFLSESLIIALVSGLLANVMAAIGCSLVNAYIESVMSISVPFAIYSVRQLFIIFGLSVATGLLASALPILRISKTKPVDLIRRD